MPGSPVSRRNHQQPGPNSASREWIGIANEGSTADATDKDIDKGLLLYVNACLILISACVVVTVLIAHG